jgi:two-component system, OmpR family, phosphate regulon response regulator PhoB
MDGYILIVENELDIADVMRRYLEFENFKIVCAATVDEARAACARELPGLILLDWHLPEVEGDEWAEELRADPDTADIPIMMMTGGYPSPALLSQLSAARIPLLIKPFSLDLLVEQIRRMGAHERVLGAAA